jgi:hypothetical protein
MDEHGLRIQIVGKLAFVYDPILLEGPSTSCVIEWGREERNLGAVKYITRDAKTKPVFHTFFYPVKKVCFPFGD